MCPHEHVLCTHTGSTSCAPTRRTPFVGCFSLGSQNRGDGSGGAEGGGVIALIQGAIKVVLLVAGHIACWTGSFLRGYIAPAFSGVPSKGDKIRSGNITPAFLGAHKWAELLRNPCVLAGPKKSGQNQKS